MNDPGIRVGRCVFTNPKVRKALWEVTDFCPLRCTYCSMNSGPTGRASFPIELAPAVIRNLSSLSVVKLVISGGEPFAYPHICELLRLSAGAGFDVSVSTSGTAIRQPILRECVVAGLRKVTVSLDGPRELHDARRGDGSFERAIKAIELLDRLGLRITANCVVGPDDGDSVAARVNYLSSLPLQEIVVCYEIPRGRALESQAGDAPKKRLLAPPGTNIFKQKPVWLLTPECESPDCPSGSTIFHVDLKGRVKTQCVYKNQSVFIVNSPMARGEDRR